MPCSCVPYAQLLAPARQAFAARPGWQPRIETTATLAAALAPPPGRQAGQLSFDARSTH
jgi:ATP-dependent helicase/nuclease subunit B